MNKMKERSVELPIIDLLASEVRESGLSLCVSEQIPSMLSRGIVSNCSTMIVGSLGSGFDIQEVSKSMGLTPEREVVLRSGLPIQHKIMKLKRIPDPFIVEFPLLEIEKNISDEEVTVHNQPILAELQKYVKPHSRILIETLKKRKRESEPDKAEEIYLLNVVEHPEWIGTERKAKLSWSNTKIDKVEKSLIKKGFIRKVESSLGRKGRNPVLIEANPTARQWLKDRGHKIVHEIRGGAEHSFGVRKIGEILEQKNFAVEYDRNGFDIEATINGRTMGVEFVMSKDQVQEDSIRRSLGFNYNKVVVVCKDNAIKNFWEKKFRTDIGKRIQFYSFNIFIKK